MVIYKKWKFGKEGRKMGQKDITEKMLADYNDVFADIVNVLLFDGKQMIDPKSLEQSKVRSQYKADDSKLHEMERDVAKYWKEEDVTIALYGIENQSQSEKIMPVRVIGYDGTAYRSQLLNNEQEEIYPVVTIVLHFGKERWEYPKNLKEVRRVPEVLNQYVNDYKIHVFEISWLTDEQVEKFQSDFRIVAEYFTQIRKNDEYKPSEQEIRHVDEVLKLLAVFGGVSEADKLLKSGNTKGVKTMSNVFGRMVEKGKAEKLLAHVEMLKNKLNLSLDEALETLGETQEEYENAKSFMQ